MLNTLIQGLPHQRWYFESVSRPPVIVKTPIQPKGKYRIVCGGEGAPVYLDVAPDFQLTAAPFNDKDDGQTVRQPFYN
jgi:hypothetical protein